MSDRSNIKEEEGSILASAFKDEESLEAEACVEPCEVFTSDRKLGSWAGGGVISPNPS